MVLSDLAARREDRPVSPLACDRGDPAGAPIWHPGAKESWDAPSFEFSPDGRTLVTCFHGVRLWKVPEGRAMGSVEVRASEFQGEVPFLLGLGSEQARFSPDGGRVLYFTRDFAALIDLKTGKPAADALRAQDKLVGRCRAASTATS